MVINFGKFCRKLRVDHDEILTDMAEKLGVSAAFLSKVEHGQKKPPEHWKEKLITLYHLDGVHQNLLEEYMFEAQNLNSIDIRDLNEDERSMMILFAKRIGSLSGDKMKQIERVLSE